MVSEIDNAANFGLAFVASGVAVSVMFYIGTLAYGIHRLEKTINALDLQMQIAKTPKRTRPVRTKTKTQTKKGIKNAIKKR